MLKQFELSPWYRRTFWAGGGHTTETDPTRRGWRLLPLRGNPDVCVLGSKSCSGCFSIRRMTDGGLDVAYYTEDGPQAVAKVLNEGGYLDAQYVLIEESWGWGLQLIEQAEAEVRYLKL